ncbi:S8 family peptidase [Deinococcus fonticola]|uniref:S8 family peptidase n=1 Tax=Deinococcus fonticola TaxID=2528713 RepID=UPI001F113376|nr:S8 family serine peptidase [Deinococcus fonticola]
MKLPLTCAALILALLAAACGSAPAAGDPPASGVGCAALGSQAMTSLSVTTTPTPAALTPATNWTAPHASGKLLIASPATMTAQGVAALQALNVTTVTPGLQEVRTPAGKTDQAFAQELKDAGLQVQPDFLYQPLAVTNDPGFPGNAGLRVNGEPMTQTYLTRIQVPAAWDVLQKCSLSLSGALTAVLDSAVDTTHPELQGRVNANVSQVGTLSGSVSHVYTHGTAAAGIIGATGNNGAGLSGIGQQQPLLLEEVMTSEGASTSDLAAALYDSVKRGAKVINISLGVPTNPGDKALDQALGSAAVSAVLVAAAGNTSTDVYYPASHPAVIAVGAVGSSDDTLTWYSARPSAPGNRALDIVAPGGAGDGSSAHDLLTLAPGGGYAAMAGTSFAAPQVAGVAALMRAANPGLSAAQTRALLLGKVNNAAGLPLLDARAAVTGAITGK